MYIHISFFYIKKNSLWSRGVIHLRSMAVEKPVTNSKVHFQVLLAVMKMIATVSRHNSFTNGSEVELI